MAWFALARVLFVVAVGYSAHQLQPLDDGGFPNAWFTDEHRRICSFSMTKNFDDLLDLFFATDRRWNLVLTC